MARTADNLVSAMVMDIWPSHTAIMDFGVTEANIGAYQDAIRSGRLTADDLHKHVYDSGWLSEAIGLPVDTGLDFLRVQGNEEKESEEESPIFR